MTMRKTGLAITLIGAAGLLMACGDQSDGGTQRTKGDIKEAVGDVTGDKSLQREGEKDQVVGGVKETVEDAKDAIKDDPK
ncbi:CsbD family protein [Caulobacter sp. 73W]|uniref:CsbD family protein n=1 Tax=Caulobacter sp. 73W TaxID=3161137 RepID=A0AB39KX19_9CAUL